MPAIEQKRRKIFDIAAAQLGCYAGCAGDLQYIFATIIEEFLMSRENDPRYQDLNDVMGALSGAEKEFFQHVVQPYEAMARDKNGDYYAEVKSNIAERHDELNNRLVPNHEAT